MIFSIAKLSSFYYGVIIATWAYVLVDFSTILVVGMMSLGEPSDTLDPSRPTSSLLGPITLCPIFGVMLFNVIFFLIQLFVVGGTDGYVKFPAHTDPSASWYYLADNWETTVLFVGIYLPLLTVAFSFSFGSVHRKPVWTNCGLCATVLGGWLLCSLLLLLDSNGFTKVFHIASQDFNSPCPASCYEEYLTSVSPTLTPTSVGDFVYSSPGCGNCPTSPIWLLYQQPANVTVTEGNVTNVVYGSGGAPSPGMSIGDRLRVWLLVLLQAVLLIVWERAGVHGFVARNVKKLYPHTRDLKL